MTDIHDWIANFKQGLTIFDDEGEQYRAAMSIAVELSQAPRVLSGGLIATGHSLGGGLASAAAIAAAIPAHTYNAAGLNADTFLDNGVERNAGSLDRFAVEYGPNNNIKQIEAYWVDWDILSFLQDKTNLPMPSAAGKRIEKDGPYDGGVVVQAILNDLGILSNFEFLATAGIPLAKSHLRPSYLYGLLSATNSNTDDNVFGPDP